MLEAKFHIYECELNRVHPSLRVYKVKIKAVYQVEHKITRRRNKLTKHLSNWEGLLLCMSSLGGRPPHLSPRFLFPFPFLYCELYIE